MLRFLVLACLGGCSLYWSDSGSGGGSDACSGPPTTYPQAQVRDPQTGQCVGYGEVTCTPCGGCTTTEMPIGDYALCDTSCTGLAEATCLATAGCQAEYLDTGALAFWGCYAVAPSGPLEGSCDGLDDHQCSRHDDCTAVYKPVDASGNTTFEACVAEPPACATLTTESDCTARGDCEPIYTGYDCTCDPSGCTCKTEVFAKCQPR